MSSVIILLLTLPWYIYIRIYLSKVERNMVVSPEIFVKSMLGYIWQIHAYFFPFIPVAIIVAILGVINHKRKKVKTMIKNCSYILLKERIILFLTNRNKYRIHFFNLTIIIINLFMISSVNNFLDTRRMISSIPFIFITFSCVLYYLYKKLKVIAISILVISMFTNLLHILPYMVIKHLNNPIIESIVKPPLPYFNTDDNWKNKKATLLEYLENMCKIESYPISYLEEIMNTYDDADKGMIEFLSKYAEKGQKVYLVGYQYETIAFYTGLKVVNRLDPFEDPLPSVYRVYPNAERYQHLTRCPIEKCDWIVERRLSEPVGDNVLWHNENKFEKFYVDFPDSKPWNEIWDHSFYTDKSYAGIYIYRNRLTTKPILTN